MKKPRISVVLNTFNEERNLSNALRSVKLWTDEIILVDMYSEDQTVEIAKKFGAKVYFHKRVLVFDEARAFAINQATGDWVLILDADELVPAPLSRRLLQIALRDEADVVLIPWLNYALGSPLMFTGWGPYQDKHPRFFKRGWMQVNARIHDFLKPLPGSRILELSYSKGFAVYHFSYIDFTQFINKMNRYTTIEASQAFDRGEQPSYFKALFRAAREFFNRYFRKFGYRDGWRGFYLSMFMAAYYLAYYAKLKELKAVGGADKVLNSYQTVIETVLKGYESGAWE